MDEITRTLIPEGGFGGGNALSLGAGAIGGLVLGSLWGNGGPWGNRNNNNGDVAYNSGMLTGIQTQLSDMSIGNLSSAIGSADRDFLAQTSSQNQFLGNLINSTGDTITAAISANTLAETQNSNATNLAMCQGFGGLNANIAQQGFNNQLAIVEQNGANRLQAQELAAQQQQCCCQVLRAIEQEGCANRELQREIQTQALRDKLCDTQNALAASVAEKNLTEKLTMLSAQLAASQSNQTAAIIAAIQANKATPTTSA